METWFTSDFHFGHSNIIKYSNRPFANSLEMDNTILANINEVVQPQDTLYFLGDFCFGTSTDVRECRELINCRNIVFIWGNHDKTIRRDKSLQTLFSSFHEQLEIKVGNQDITLNHYAMRVWNKSHRGAYHLYAHSHGSLPDDPSSLSFDVGVDCHGYRPINMDRVNETMSKKVYQPIDHHGAKH